jgi:hypothetical protein
MMRPLDRDRITDFGHGRVCAADDCSTVLSKYNPSAYCVVHSPASASCRAREGRTAETVEASAPGTRQCANTTCGLWFETTNPRRVYCSDRCRVVAFYARRRRSSGGTGERRG